MSTLIVPRSIRGTDAADNALADEQHAAADEDARALDEGIARTLRWAKTPPIFERDDIVFAVTMPGVERVIHQRPDRASPTGFKLRVYPIRPARPCPGCGTPIYGIGEVQSATAPWHLACWEMEQAMEAMAQELAMQFDAQGLPVAAEGRTKVSDRPRLRRRRR